METVIYNINLLAGIHAPTSPLRQELLASIPVLQNAFLHIKNDLIVDFGSMDHFDPTSEINLVDAKGGTVLPSWCDSHTHLVFARTREEEFVDKIKGATYAEIAQKGGGILSSVKSLRELSEEELYEISLQRLLDAAIRGTGAIEIKSGYGLDTANELKMLRVIRKLKENSPVLIRSTFLGAHAIPPEYKEKRDRYIDLIIEEMIPAIAEEGLAEFIDVFCEEGFFSPAETWRICNAGMHYGMKPKIHANQLHASGGVEVGVELGAVSVDHLETMDQTAIHALKHSSTIGTLLPTAAFFLRMNYQPARTLIEEGCAIALASDFNPGSSPGFDMNFVVSLACIQMRMTPEEAINAATINGAFAMDLQDKVGSISPGKLANIILTKPIRSLAALPYNFSSNLISNVMLKGQWLM